MAADQPLDPRYIPLERVVGQLVTAVISIVALVALVVVAVVSSIDVAFIGLLAGGWGILTAALVWLAHRWPALEYRHAAYRLSDEAMEIRGGVLWRHVTNVPRSRVQHTDVAQGPLERRYGLATLVVHTAGTEHARVELAGLAHETALQLRDHLLPREASDAV